MKLRLVFAKGQRVIRAADQPALGHSQYTVHTLGLLGAYHPIQAIQIHIDFPGRVDIGNEVVVLHVVGVSDDIKPRLLSHYLDGFAKEKVGMEARVFIFVSVTRRSVRHP